MRLLIAAVGRLKTGPERELCARYVERANQAGRGVGLGPVEIREVVESNKRLAADRLREEGKALRGLAPNPSRAIALDARGRNLTSEQFAEKLAALRGAGARTAVFYIGGADGLAEEVRRNAELGLAFGAVTIPHQLARILLVEQIYRAMTILSGHPYHRGE
jgi:23S rRNA (pseudouridine1915-N3)-methyltransferase